MEPPPDVVLLGAEWNPRALIRAQLIEEGFDVVATSSWPEMRRQLRPGRKPRLAIVDLKGLHDPETVLHDLGVLMKPNQVLVLTAAGTLAAGEVERLGFQVVSRPIVLGEIVRAARSAIEG